MRDGRFSVHTIIVPFMPLQMPIETDNNQYIKVIMCGEREKCVR